jgi:hypothetical protein
MNRMMPSWVHQLAQHQLLGAPGDDGHDAGGKEEGRP